MAGDVGVSGGGERVSSTEGIRGARPAGATVARVQTEGVTADAGPLGSGVIRHPRAILALLTACNLLNYVDRYVLSAVLPKLQDDLHLSNWVGGWLATVFLIGYFAASPIFGVLGDRAGTGGRKRLMTLGVSVWSLATAASGLAPGGPALFAARAAVGIGEASYATIAPTLIDDLARPLQKARWMAFFNAAMPVGSALGYIVGGSVEQSHGWRAAFLVVGVPGLAAALLCLLVAEPRRRASVTASLRASAAKLIASSQYRTAVLGYCAYTFAIGGFAYWAPTYVYRRYGLEVGRASVQFGTITVVAGFLGTLAGGWLADAWASRHATTDPSDDGVRSGLLVCALSAGLGAPLAAAAILAPTRGRFFALAALCEVAVFLSNGPVNVVLLRTAPAALRASAMAFAIFAIHLFGDMWSQPLIGLFADRAPWPLAMSVVPLFFALASIVWLRASARSARLT